MRRLIWLTLIVVACLALLVIAPSLVDQKGYVLIQAGSHVIQTNLISLTIMIFGAVAAYLLLAMLVKRLLRLFSGSRHWFGTRKTKRLQKRYEHGLQALMLGQPKQAVMALEDTVGAEFGGLNYLALAQAHLALEQHDSANKYLALAKEYDDAAETAVILGANAELKLGQADKAVALLKPSMDTAKPSANIVKTYARALAEDGQWTELAQSLASWKKQLGDDYANWAKGIARGKLSEVASRHGANQLKQTWAELPRKQRNDEVYIFAYIEQLLAQGMHADGQRILLDSQKKGPNAVLLPLFKQLELADPSPSFRQLEQWIKADSENAELYSTLGHLAYHCADPVLAQKALSKAIALKPTQADMLLLAQLSEDNNDASQALTLYKQSAEFV